MLRSAATPNRTEVQSSPAMKQTTTRRILSTLTVLARSGCAPAVKKLPAKLNLPHSLV